jgi:hypothetical protein
MCLMAAFVPHRSNKYFHVMASNGIVSSSAYISSLHLQSHRFGYSKLRSQRCRCEIRAIIVLNHHRFWGYASGPSSSSNTLPSSTHGHAARRSALPRERFSPLAQSGHSAGSARRRRTNTGHAAPHRPPCRAEDLIPLRSAGRRSRCMRHHPLGIASD